MKQPLDNELPLSRSQQKRESLALQQLAEKLSGLPREEIQKLQLPAEIVDALLMAAEMKKRSGFRRQVRYIGGLMRQIDVEHIKNNLAEIDGDNSRRTAFFLQAEQWRDQLIEGKGDVYAAILADFPAADIQRIRQLTRNALKEKKNNKPARSAKELFRTLLRMLEDARLS